LLYADLCKRDKGTYIQARLQTVGALFNGRSSR
jgi:hypothetical protein